LRRSRFFSLDSLSAPTNSDIAKSNDISLQREKGASTTDIPNTRTRSEETWISDRDSDQFTLKWPHGGLTSADESPNNGLPTEAAIVPSTPVSCSGEVTTEATSGGGISIESAVPLETTPSVTVSIESDVTIESTPGGGAVSNEVTTLNVENAPSVYYDEEALAEAQDAILSQFDNEIVEDLMEAIDTPQAKKAQQTVYRFLANKWSGVVINVSHAGTAVFVLLKQMGIKKIFNPTLLLIAAVSVVAYCVYRFRYTLVAVVKSVTKSIKNFWASGSYE